MFGIYSFKSGEKDKLELAAARRILLQRAIVGGKPLPVLCPNGYSQEFLDGFETDEGFPAWDTALDMERVTDPVHSGSYAAQASVESGILRQYINDFVGYSQVSIRPFVHLTNFPASGEKRLMQISCLVPSPLVSLYISTLLNGWRYRLLDEIGTIWHNGTTPVASGEFIELRLETEVGAGATTRLYVSDVLEIEYVRDHPDDLIFEAFLDVWISPREVLDDILICIIA